MAEKLRNLMCRRWAARPLWQHLCALLAIGAVCVGLFFWAGYTWLPGAANQSQRQIVNDDYAVLTRPLGAGGEVRQQLEAKGRLYGVQLKMHTYGRVPHGTLHLRLLDATGAQVAACDTDMTRLLDDTFHRFLFGQMVDAGEGAAYTLVFTATPATGEDRVAFWRSDGPAEDFVEAGAQAAAYPLDSFALWQDGAAVDGTLALQYTVRYAGGFIYRAFAFFAALLTVFLMALYVLLFMLKAPLHRVFIVCALVLGFVFMFLIPPRTAPDEYTHIANSYHYSNLVLGTAQEDGGLMLSVRAGDEMKLYNYDPDATGVFAWQDLYEGLFEGTPGGDMVQVPARLGTTFAPLYLAPTVGVVLARLLGLGQVGLLMLGRLANLVFYAVLVSRAVKRMPVAKPLIFCVALLPGALQLAASFSYDTYTMAICFYFIACCLQYALASSHIGWRQVLLLAVLVALIAPAKAVYVLLALWVLVIPAQKFPSRRFALGGRVAVLAAAALVWAAFNLVYLQVAVTGQSVEVARAEQYISATGGLEGFWDENGNIVGGAGAAQGAEGTDVPGGAGSPAESDSGAPFYRDGVLVWPNGDAVQFYSLGYTLGHLPGALKVVLNSVWEQSSLWLQGLVGGRLGEIIAIHIEVNWLFVVGLAAVLCLAALPSGGDRLALRRKTRLGAAGLAAGVFLLTLGICLTWTPVNYAVLFGMQGRYLLPVLPLLLLALRGRGLVFRRPVGNRLAAASAALCVLVQLDAFGAILRL